LGIMESSVLELFERNASACPDALAIAFAGRRLTYRQLNFAAEQIADGLREAGVTPGCLVGVLLDRSPEMVAALLAIWKAAAGWVPLDPTSPVERIAFMLEDAAPLLLLTSRKFSAKAPISRTAYLEDLCARKNPACVAPSAVSEQDLAYVIFTSGSTGKPKGAKLTHGGLANTIQGVTQDLKLTPDDVVLAWSTIAFDVACLEIYLPLAAGASLYLTECASVFGPALELIRRSAATVVFGTPTMYRLLFEQGWRGDAAMQVIVGGEVLPLGLARTLAASCRAVWNQYGPTETTICATRAKVDVDAEKVTIGRPLPNVTVHLLDQNLQPVPKGSIGELYIAGAGVGLGYLRHPFAGGGQGAMYKSGDLALQLANGEFEFLGRVDQQVKLRGYRIEPGEIESLLMRCEGVRAVVVRVIELEPGDHRLIAFVVGERAFLSRWKRFLPQHLPHYMVPSEFVTLPSFPTTPNGKVDLRALDAMRLGATTIPSEPQPGPRDPIEARLKTIWERVLKVKPVGLDQDFFALGGHSLLAARMLTQVEQWSGCKLPHSVLLEQPTIHRLAAYLRESRVGKWPAVVTIQSGASLPPLFIAHGIGGSLLSFLDLAAELGPQQPVYGLQLPGFIDPREAELGIVAANYVRQVRALQPRGPYHLAGHSSGGLVVFEMACQLMEQGETVGLLALLDCDPNTGKLVHRPFHDWRSLKASFRRAYTELTVRDLRFSERLERRMVYQKIKVSTWLAARSRRAGRARPGRASAKGHLALALREYKLRPYSGDAILFVARDEPGRNADPAGAWAGKILGGCETRLLPGTHRTILTHPQVVFLAREITQALAVALV
jgi:amino acid adenylation domain-containing protein